MFSSGCGTVSGGDCEAWSSWTTTGTSCNSKFWCFLKGQQASYQNYEATRQCKNAIQKKTKKIKLKCGC